MAKTSDHQTLVELFRDRGLEIGTSNGNIQLEGNELQFSPAERLIGIAEDDDFIHEDVGCDECMERASMTDHEKIREILKLRSVPFDTVGKLEIRSGEAVFKFKPGGELDSIA